MKRHRLGIALLLVFSLVHIATSKKVDESRLLVGLSALRRNATRGSVQGIACVGDAFQCVDNGRCIPRSWLCDGDIDCAGAEDEKNCPEECGVDEHKCGTGPLEGKRHSLVLPCIPKRWMCDGEFDCEDKSDEAGCPKVTCTDEQMMCSEMDGQFHMCIPKAWKCDQQVDCSSGEDEKDCPHESMNMNCSRTDYRCDNGMCIFKNWVCDGEPDCEDRSDEKNCEKTPEETCAAKKMFKCASSEGCIPNDWRCDGEADCLDHSDERNCNANPHQCRRENEFACVSGDGCVNKMWVCDGDEDCPDGSDENQKECGDPEKTCDASEFKCPHGRCLPADLKCNGEEDCMGGEDELGCPATNETLEVCDPAREFECPFTPTKCIKLENLCREKKYTCEGSDVCEKNITQCTANSSNCDCRASFVKGAQVCTCKPGFEAKSNICQDIDECKTTGTCDQICTNKLGTYECSCHHGYKLSRGKASNAVASKCRAIGGDPLVLLSNRASIRQFDLATNEYTSLIQSEGSAVALDFHIANGSLFWSDIAAKQILMCHVGNETTAGHPLEFKNDCKDAGSVVVEQAIHTPDGIAVDWVHDLLFWTDGGMDQINVMDMKTRKRRILFDKDIQEPRAIALDPELGLIFWTDWGSEACIERSGMDGQHRTVIVKGDNVKWPNGLAVDLVHKRIYWADAKVKSIFSADYYGRDIKTVLHSHHNLRHPFSLTVFEDTIYYTDWEQDGVLTVNKFTGEDVKKVMHPVHTPMTVRIYHKQVQPSFENKCDGSGCSDICLPRAHIRKESAEAETEWYGRPYACVCQGNTASDVVECALDVAAAESSGFSLTSMLVLLIFAVAVVGAVALFRRRNQGSSFTALNFDNPIYRRTTEEVDMENPFRDGFDNGATVNPRLVLATDVEADIQHNGSSMIDPMDRPLTA